MKNNKKIISLLLSVILFLSEFSPLNLIVHAESKSAHFLVESVEAEQGEKNVAVSICIINNPGIASVALDIHYDENALSLTDFIYNTDALGGASTVPYNNTAKPPCVSMVDGQKNITGDFVFATLYFDIAENAIGSYNIAVTYDEDNVYSIDETNIDFQTISGKIIVKETENTKPAFVVSNTTVAKGTKNVPVSIMIKNNPGVASVALDILYDHDYLTLTDFVYNIDPLSGASTVPFNATANPPCLSIVNGTQNMDDDFTIATLYFDVSDTASGSYEISLLYDEDNVYDINENNILFDVNSGVIRIAETTPTEPSVTDPTQPTSGNKTETYPTTPTITEPMKTNISKWIVKGIKNKTYTGSLIKQKFEVISPKGEYAEFTAKYYNNKEVGTAKIVIKGTGEYTGTITKTFRITKATNPVSVKIATKSVNRSKLKKKAQTVNGAITVKKAQGKVSYKLTSTPKVLKKLIKINTKGVITISKWSKAKKGTYNIKVKITAAGNKNYNSKALTKTVIIKVK